MNEFFTLVIGGALGSQLASKVSLEALTFIGIAVLIVMAMFGWVVPAVIRKKL